MTPRLEEEAKRLIVVAPASLVKRIDQFRKAQSDLPGMSEALRRLIELGLEAAKKR